MTIDAIQSQRSGKEPHRAHELIHRNSLEYLDVLEYVLRHLRLLRGRGLAECQCDTEEARGYSAENSKHRPVTCCLHPHPPARRSLPFGAATASKLVYEYRRPRPVLQARTCRALSSQFPVAMVSRQPRDP